MKPSISKEQFESIGFRQWHYKEDDDKGEVWSVVYHKNIPSETSNKEWIDIS